MPGNTQANRLMQFSSPYGQDVLLIESLEGVEGISRLFDFQAELLADAGADLDPQTIVGEKVTINLGLLDVQGTRYINGIVASFEQTAGDTTFDVYRAHIVPSIWQLTLATNCRVFQNETVMDIIKAVIAPYSLSVGDVTTVSYKPLDYCTQYNETDFNFISRLAEQFGIFYWFEHSDGDHKIVFGDSRDAYSECPLVSEVQYSPQFEDRETMYHSVVSDVRVTSTMLTGKHSARDYDFRGYSSTQNGPFSSTQPFGKNAYERYHFVSGESAFVKIPDKQLSDPDHGAIFLQSQADASDANGNVYHGTSTARTFIPGFTFDLTQHTRDSWNQSYLITEAAHNILQVPPYRGDSSGIRMPYTNRYVAIESTQIYRPEKRTRKPMAFGPQTARVVTPSGEDLHLDKYGRVCVQFFWDRDREDNTPDNTWVRVGQPWAGNMWGTYIWPRVNDEVIIHFLHGDPDEPVCVGSVYNGTNMPKYELPDMGTRTGIVTCSSTGGAQNTFNELRFEDKMGSEQIFMHAQMDMDHRVLNDMRTYVMAKDSLKVDKDQLEMIGGNYNRSIGGDRLETVAGKQEYSLTGNLAEKIDGTVGSTVGGDFLQAISGKQGIKVTKEVDHQYDDSLSVKIAQNHAEKVGMNYALDAGMEAYLKAGMTLVIESGMNLCLKGAGGFITIGPAGIAISGTMVMINSGGAAVPGTAGTIKEPDAPAVPGKITDPDEADDGSKGGKM